MRVIITAYRTKKISDDHPYIWRYTARRALVIFDHPYNADSACRADVSITAEVCTDYPVLPAQRRAVHAFVVAAGE
jgi:hypothetical protein